MEFRRTPKLRSPGRPRLRAAAAALTLVWFVLVLVNHGAAWITGPVHLPRFERVRCDLAGRWPVDPGAPLRAAGGLLAAAAAAGAVFSAGRGVLRFVLPRGAGGEAPFAAAAGFAACGGALIGAGCCGLFRWPVVVPVLVGCGLAGTRWIRAGARARRRIRPFRPVSRAARAGPVDRWAAACAVTAVAAMFAMSIGPETEIDSLIYHLARARHLVLEGRYLPQPSLMFGFPPLWETWLAAMLAVGGEQAARLLNPAVLAACGWMILRAVDREVPGAGVRAAALFLTSLLALGAAAAAKTDPAATWLAFAAFAAALRAPGAGGMRWAALAGLLAGSALMVKYTAGPVVLLAGAALWRTPIRARPRRVAAFTAVAVLVWLPWAAYNMLAEGNPVHPLLPGISRSGPGPGATANLRDDLRRYVNGRYDTVADRLRAVWSLAVTEGVTPLPVLALPAIVAALSRGAAARWWPLGTAALVAAWSVGPPQPRYLLPALPLAAGALAIFGATAGAGRAARWREALLAILMAAGAARGWLDPSRDLGARLDVALGALPRDAYLRLRLTTYADAILEANAAPGSGRVLFFGERRSWPLDRGFIATSFDDPAPILRAAAASRDAAHLARKVRQSGATSAVYNFVTASYLGVQHARTRPPDRALAVWAEYWRRHAVLRHLSPCSDDIEGEFATFDLERRPHGRPPPLLPAAEGWLEECTRLAESGDRAGALAALDRVTRLTGDYPVFALRRVWLAGDSMPAGRARAELERAEAADLRIAHLYGQLAKAAHREGRADVFKRARARLAAMVPERWLRRTLAP